MTRLAIVGVGLIGTSIALAARRRWSDLHIIAIDRPDRLSHPAIVDVCDLASSDLRVVGEADTIVIATPVDAIVGLIPALAGMARSDALVLDAGSTKRAVMAAARDAGLTAFVGGHPMAGAEQSGPDGARADLFDGRQWFLIQQAEGEHCARAETLVACLGATPMWTDAATHDRVMAAVSHLPQVVASALMNVADDAAGEKLAWAGAGLRDTTRLAASDASTWESVLTANADELAPLVGRLSDALRQIADDLTRAEAVRRLFEAANRSRARLDESREV